MQREIQKILTIFILKLDSCMQTLRSRAAVVVVLKYKRMAQAGHVWRSNSLMKVVLKWKPLRIRPLGRPKQRQNDPVEKNSAEIGVRDGEIIAQG